MTPSSPPSLPTVGAALAWAARELARTDSASLVGQALLAHAYRQPRCWTLAHPEIPLPPAVAATFAALVRRAREGEPLAYLTGIQEFFGLEFEVTPAVLIPRPETELMVDTALEWLAERSAAEKRGPSAIRALDLGTGSGCIAAALAVHTPGLRVTAADLSADALAVAARNFRRHAVADRIRPVQADLLTPFRGRIDLLCANLPYAFTPALASLPSLRFEPRLALDGGDDGLRLVGRALGQSASRMAAGGLALFELDAVHAEAARQIAKRLFPQSTIKIKKDLAGWERLLVIREP
ncbi:MAG: peptide chain release factor N(5)-glutamine methyltransferase [Anaerolineales bacterium]|nr:peptide chain release factor N(5)-glutamine methyltransferase [Anaerolineales bacterium]